MALDAAAILTGIECKYMTSCLVLSILPNFYEINTNLVPRAFPSKNERKAPGTRLNQD